MSEKNIENMTKLGSNFAQIFVDHHLLPDINFDGHCLINNISIPKKVGNLYISYTLNLNLHIKSYTLNWLNRCVASCNTLNDSPNKVCVPIKTEDLNLNVFNMITGIYESNFIYVANLNVILIKENVIQISGGITANVDVNVKNAMYVKKITFGILLCEIVKLENI